MITIIVIIIIISIFWIIPKIIESHKQGIRDKAAHDILDHKFDLEKEKAEILKINKTLGFEKDKFVCPSCHYGILNIQNGTYTQFYVCNNYRRCNYKKEIK